MLTLYDYEFSGNGWKVRTLLRHLGRPFCIRWVACWLNVHAGSSVWQLEPPSLLQP